MKTTAYWLRLTLRRKWLTLVALTLVVAIASGTVMALVAGARRGGSAWDRFVTQGRASHALISPLLVQPDYDKVRALPYVEGVVETPYANVFITDPASRQPATVIFTSTGPFDSAMERLVVVDGRAPDQSRANEVVVSGRFARDTGRGVGSTITTVVPAPGYGQYAGSVAPVGVVPQGQRVVLDVVGVARVPTISTAFGIDTSWVLPTQAYWQEHGDAISASTAGPEGPSPSDVRIGALVRLKGGEADVPRLTKDISAIITAQSKAVPTSGGPPGASAEEQTADVSDLVVEAAPTRATTRFERLAVLALAAGAGLAALVVVGLLVARRARAFTVEAEGLAPIGLTRGGLASVGTAPLVVVGVAGALLGAALSVFVSPIFPIGLSRFVEPTPGLQADGVVLLAGVVLTVLIVLVIATASAWRWSRSRANDTKRARISGQRWVALLPSLPTAIGASRGTAVRGPGTAGPLWLAPAIGVLGIVAGATMGAGVYDATHEAALYSPGPSAAVSLGFGNQMFNPTDDVERELRASKAPAPASDIAATYDIRTASATANGKPLNVVDIGASGDRPARPVLEGRLPDGPAEIALGPGAARQVGVDVGGTVVLDSGVPGSKATDFTVVGLVLGDWQGNASYDLVGIVNQDGYDDLFGDTYGLVYKLVVFTPGTDASAWIDEWSRVNQAYDYADPIEEPRAVTNLGRLIALPWILGAFLAFLGIVGLAGGLAASQNAARKGQAVLRSLGFTRSQSRASVEWEGAFAGVVAVVVGVPLGVVVGRALWRSIAGAVPVAYAPPATDGLVLVVAVVAIGLALLLAVVPAWRSGRLPVPELLRQE